MKVKVVQDAIVFISSITKAELDKAKKFMPAALTLYEKQEDKTKVPVFTVAYGESGYVNANGIVFDSTNDEGYLVKTVIVSQGDDAHISTADKIQLISERFADTILKMNDLEQQIAAALDYNATKIETAMNSIEAVEL